ncbi:MAG TPA: hypothetical protein VLB76_25735 [Thermoanaerobaculia bacterium]|jgi:hypothetical protein|nr:hypothetical protein [Thermoanaerobaculia bacterium]
MALPYLIQCHTAPGLCLETSSPAINAFVRLSFISTFKFVADIATDRWILDDGYIYLADNIELVIGVAGSEIIDGASLLIGQKLPGRQAFQRWDWTTVPLCIKNVMSPGNVIDCADGQPGTDIRICQSSGVPTQQWTLTPLPPQ